VRELICWEILSATTHPYSEHHSKNTYHYSKKHRFQIFKFLYSFTSDDLRYPGSVPKPTDEQSALNKILQQTATNVIDVAALDSHNLEQHEYVERARQYIQKAQTAQPVLASKYNKLVLVKNSGKPNISFHLTSMIIIPFFKKISRGTERYSSS